MHVCIILGMARTPAPRETRRTSLLLDLWMVGHEMSALLDEALASSGLSADDFGLYSLLKGWGPVTPSQISRWTGMRPTTVSLSLKRLNGRGHGEQTPNPQDGRSYLVGLNAAGEAAHSAAATLFLTGNERFRSEMAPSDHEARATVQRIDAALRSALDLDDRPYSLADDDRPEPSGSLTYPGPPLDPAQEERILQYIEFVRSQPG
jgi:DNA-binding MarR family transcriptional regulator